MPVRPFPLCFCNDQNIDIINLDKEEFYMNYTVATRKPIIVKKGSLKSSTQKTTKLIKQIKELEKNSFVREDGAQCFPNAKIID